MQTCSGGGLVLGTGTPGLPAVVNGDGKDTSAGTVGSAPVPLPPPNFGPVRAPDAPAAGIGDPGGGGDSPVVKCRLYGKELLCNIIHRESHRGPRLAKPPKDTLHPMAQWALELTENEHGGLEEAVELRIYTDGTLPKNADHDKAAWSANVVSVNKQGNLNFLGSIWHSVTGSGKFVDKIQKLSSTTVELTAVLWTLVWATGANVHCPTTVHVDNQTAIGLSEGRFASQVHDEIAALIRNLMCSPILKGKISFAYVAAHIGHPWNELADSVAKWAAKESQNTWLPPIVCEALSGDPGTDWQWLSPLHEDSHAYPPIVGGQFQFKTIANDFDAPAQAPPDAQSQEPMGSMELLVVTHNVTSLYSQRVDKTTDTPRAKALLGQYYEQGVMFAGMQETRRQAFSKLVFLPIGPDGAKRAAFYNISSGAEGGNYGCEFVVNLVKPYITVRGVKHTFKAKQFVTLHSTPRLLVVQCSTPFFSCRILVGHAPTSEAAQADKDSFWQVLEGHLEYRGWVLLFVDANARHVYLGEAPQKTGPKEMQYSGELFNNVVSKAQLASPVTMPKFCNKVQDTWYSHNTRSWHTIDYIFTNCAVSDKIIGAGRFKFDTLNAGDDHVPSWARFLMPLNGAKKSEMFRDPDYDLSKCKDPERAAKFAAILNATPLPKWDEQGVDGALGKATGAVARAAKAAFPKEGFQVRKKCLQPVTVGLIAFRRFMRKLKSKANRKQKLFCLRRFFHIWVTKSPPTLQGTSRGPSLTVAFCANQLTKTANIAKSFGRSDVIEEMAALGSKVNAANVALQAKLVWDSFKKLMLMGGKGCKNKYGMFVPMLLKPDGTPAQSPEEVVQIKEAYFAGIESGEVVSFGDLAKRHNQATPASGGPVASVLSVNNIQSKRELEKQIVRSKKGKKHGPDAQPNDLFAVAPQAVARHFHPVLTLASLGRHEPLLFKGGVNHDLHKGKGPAEIMRSYRAILLSNHIGKHHHKFYRSKLFQLCNAWFLSTQCGGLPGKGTDMANIMLRMSQRTAKDKGYTQIAMFVDVTNAFYTVYRETLVPLRHCEEDIQQYMENMSVPLAFQAGISALMAQPTILENMVKDTHIIEAITDVCRNKWFYIQGSRNIVATKKGVCPGDPLADLLFNICILPILNNIGDGIVQAKIGIPPQSAADGPYSRAARKAGIEVSNDSLKHIAYVDDVVALAQFVKQKDLRPTTVKLVRTVKTSFNKYGLVLNMSPGKTELMYTAAGPERKQILHELKVELRGKIEVDADEVVITPTYQHLGGIAAEDGNMQPELSHRIRECNKTHGQLKPALKFSVFSTQHKVLFTDALAHTRLFYMCQTWHPLGKTQMERVNSSLTAGYRLATGNTHKPGSDAERVPDLQVLLDAARLDASDQIKLARLHFLGRLALKGPSVIFQFLDACILLNCTFANVVLVDLQWAAQFVNEFDKLPTPPARHPSCWLDEVFALCLDGNKWTNLLKQVANRALSFVQDQRRHQLWRRMLGNLYAKHRFTPPPFCPAQETPPAYLCYECGEMLADPKGWWSHKRQRHPYVPLVDRYVSGTSCRMCLVDYGTCSRLRKHLQDTSPGCLQRLVARASPISEEEAVEIKVKRGQEQDALAALGYDRHSLKALVPAFRRQGPLEQSMTYNQSGIPRGKKEYLECKDWWPDGQPIVCCGTQSDLPKEMPIPPVLEFNVYYAFNLFSGQRRPQDFQNQLELLLEQHPLPLVVISVDIVNNPIKGNLADMKILRLWGHHVLSGKGLVSFGGPPCNTFSAARYLPVPEGKKGPRPIRSEQSLWGLPNVSASERLQLDLSNALLRAELYFLHLASISGTAAAMEHPDIPKWIEGAPSSWKLEEFKYLDTLDCSDHVVVDQCMLGADARKATRFYLINFVEFRQQIEAVPNCARCNHKFKHVPLRGKDKDRSWNTAPAKQYQPPLCGVMARAAHASVAKWIEPGPVDWEAFSESEESQFYMPLDPFCSWQEWGAFGNDTGGAQMSSACAASDDNLNNLGDCERWVEPYVAASRQPDSVCTITPALRRRIDLNRAQALRRKAARGARDWVGRPAGPRPGAQRAPTGSVLEGGLGHPHIACSSTVRYKFCFGKVTKAIALAHTAMAAAGKHLADARPAARTPQASQLDGVTLPPQFLCCLCLCLFVGCCVVAGLKRQKKTRYEYQKHMVRLTFGGVCTCCIRISLYHNIYMVGHCMLSFLARCMCKHLIGRFLTNNWVHRDVLATSDGAWWGDGPVQPRPAPHGHT